SGNFVSFRLFGYEDQATGFNIYRDGTLLNTEPLVGSTNWLDEGGTGASSYTVARSDRPNDVSPAAKVWQNGYLEIPTPVPPAGNGYTYTSGDGSAADLDGDGRYDLVIKWDPSNARDNSQDGVTGNTFLDGYTFDGAQLYRIDLGRNIRAGAHYSPFLVYDLDGDGRAEILVKTAPGTRDGTGAYLSKGPAAADDDAADYRNSDGYILTGPEYLTLFDGQTGAEIDTKAFEVARGNVGGWGDTYGNRVDRFVGSIAFVDDTGRPSAIMGRGMYTRTTFSAWNYRDGELTRAWVADHANNTPFGGRGAHSLTIGNVDDDPNQEIVNGGATFDHDGSGICSVPFYGHGDAIHLTDLIPSRPGLELFQPYEAQGVPAFSMRDARTCEVLWKGPNSPEEGPGRGVAADVDPTSPGAEAWVNSSQLMRGEGGQEYADRPDSSNFLIWWDGDLSRELLNGNAVRQYDSEGGILTANGCSANNGSKSVPTLSADIIGDWREEVIFRCGDKLRVYTTNELTETRIYTLMHDPQYRAAISWQNGGYNQPPHPSFHIGAGMVEPPRPDIHLP
ncbi:MAG TPA: rhamnogalacturonan lyase, partial [Polyangiaceae bacterium]|nr:rhamnogalacturonan lyase [Polyangiaceae bacterium]